MTPMTGRTIGNYRLIAKLGEGGMGKVYRAVELMVEREVALKSLKPEIAAQPGVLERFRSEAMTLAKLNHPAIAHLYTFFKDGDDFYMVMEYVPGSTLEQIIQKEGAMPWRRAFALTAQILEGIAHANEMGILHRDLKPANIMLTAAGKVKLMDFGIAQALGAARMTREGRIIGTLEYLAPERIQGKPASVRSDLYSVGALLYEMVTGRLPFNAESEYELLAAHVQQQAPAPRELGIALPDSVENAIMRALAKNPDDRYPDAASFGAQLAALIREAAPPELKPTRLAETMQADALTAEVAPRQKATASLTALAHRLSPKTLSPKSIAAASGAAVLALIVVSVAVAHLFYSPAPAPKAALIASEPQTALPPESIVRESTPPATPIALPPAADPIPINPPAATPPAPTPAPEPPAPRPVKTVRKRDAAAAQPAQPFAPAPETRAPVADAPPAAAPPAATPPQPVAPRPVEPAPIAAPPIVKSAPARRIQILADVRTVYVEPAQDGLDADIRAEIRKQLGGRLAVTDAAAGADAVLRVTLEQPKGGALSHAGQILGIKNRSQVLAVIEDSSSKRVLWEQGAGDKKPIVGAFHGDSLKRLAERIVKELRESM
jgi:serine/threonine-protein kinase